MLKRSILAVLALGLALTACGKNQSRQAAFPDHDFRTAKPTAAPSESKTPDKPEVKEQPVDTSSKPTVTVPQGDPPTTLQVRDLVEGHGAEAKAGSTVTVHYVGVAWSTQQEFDASWNRGEPFPVTLGEGRVIPGWEQGLLGVKEGTRRELIIPPDLAYGSQGAGGVIGPNETLIFVVDVLAVE